MTKLTTIAKQYSNTVAIQRLGYILETELLQDKLADSLWKMLNQRTYFPTPLSSKKGRKGDFNNRWKIIKNIEIENDL
jgi:predicted transcriptional regulator of viral defense system